MNVKSKVYESFVGAYVTAAEKSMLTLWASQQQQSLSSVIRALIAEKATKPLSGEEQDAAQQQ
jgi:hypothetical protein